LAVSTSVALSTGANATTIDGQSDHTGRIAAGGTIEVPVLGRGGVPASGVGSVALNVTVTSPAAAGYLVVWPTGQPTPLASNVNYSAGQTVPNMVVVPVGAGGKVSLQNGSTRTIDAIIDVLGWFPPGSFNGLTPARIMDTRTPPGQPSHALGQGEVRNLTVTGSAGVPASGVAAVAVNVTVTDPTRDGYITVFPAGEAQPATSSVNFVARQTVPNLVVSGVGANGQISILNPIGSTQVVVDILGWFPVGGSFHGVTPSRMVDTRSGQHTDDGQYQGIGAIAGGSTLDVALAGRGGVPSSGAGSVALNVTVTNPSAAGFLTVWP
ncbi:unnamed protein product, partial [Phaeothamnion confervicola]